MSIRGCANRSNGDIQTGYVNLFLAIKRQAEEDEKDIKFKPKIKKLKSVKKGYKPKKNKRPMEEFQETWGELIEYIKDIHESNFFKKPEIIHFNKGA